MRENSLPECAVLILCPVGRDAELAGRVLESAGFRSEPCANLNALLTRLSTPAGALVIAEEALDAADTARLIQWLAGQPPWSDLPVILLTTGGSVTGTTRKAFDLFGSHGNVTLLERPLRIITLRSTVQAALRARRRQYEVRDLLQDRDKAVAEIREANRAKDQFLAALSHELRTPLTPVLMTVAALRQDPDLPESILSDLVTIERNVELEARLIDDLLDLTRVTQGKLILQAKVVDLYELIERSLENCRSGEASRKGLRITVKADASEHYTLGDPARIQQILWNLLNNATKFTPAGGRLEIRTFNSKPGRIAVSVSDSGIGLDPVMLPKLFDAFQQGDSSITRRFGGLGLGLAISRTLADLHGGTLSAESGGRGCGATFTLELNVAAAPIEKADSRNGSESTCVPPCIRILLVEDHEPTRMALARLLKRAGHEVTTAGSVGRALDLASERSFDLLVSDLGLPDASGLDLMRELRSRYLLPGIALSGYGMEEDVRASREAGFHAHVTKPVDWRRLKETLESVFTEAVH